MKNFKHPLMESNFTQSDIDLVIKLLKKKNVTLTQSTNVLKFEKAWSKWLGVKYSVFVNSGSSANLLSISTLKILHKKKKKNIILPALTWSSDIASVIQNNFKPVFVDIYLNNLSMNLDEVKKKINKKTLAVFVTHAQGFNALTKEFIDYLKRKKIILIEDVCESHGATLNNKKLGTFGLISNFSFYYAHHMSTIEGGMICTNNKNIYELARLLRSHGMARELSEKKDEMKIIKDNPKLSPKFIFIHPSYNMRNNEIGAVLGLNQLKRLDKNNIKRVKNLKIFLGLIDPSKYYINFNLKGNSNYAFPVILKTLSIKKRNIFEKVLKNYNIEFRRGNAGGGNQLRQPYLKKYVNNVNFKQFRNVEKVHFFGYYIGNYPSLTETKILKICKILNSVKF
jgi:CDP-4-dehydro-6-deoxyglucose reductase, E1